MATRRPSMSLSMPLYTAGDDQQIQKAIQALRLKSQESLAQSREEIARLEEVNEIKQMRIAELDAEIAKLEEELGGSELEETSGRQRAKRRWSLAAFGIVNQQNNSNSDAEQRGRSSARAPQSGRLSGQRSKSVDVDYDSNEEDLGGKSTPFSIMGSLTKKKPNRKSNRESYASTGDKMEMEARLMQRLHDIQQENKKIIEQQETELEFKNEQVTAMQLASEEQGNIIDDLQQQIYDMRQNTQGDVQREEKFISEEDKIILNERLATLNNQENEINSQLRLIRRIQGLDDDERKATISELKRTIVESSIRLNSVKRMFEANKEMLETKASTSESDWAKLSIKISLMERVSQKQMSRLEKKVAKGQSEELIDVIDRARQALEEEIDMRTEPEEESIAEVIKRETDSVENLVAKMLSCSQSFAEGLKALQSKELSVHIVDTLVTTLRQMEKAIEAADNTIMSSLYVVDEVIETYAKDDALIPEDVQSMLKDEGDDKPDGEMEKMFDCSSEKASEDDIEVADLQDQHDEVNELVRDTKLKLEEKQIHSEQELDDVRSRVDELKRTFKDLGAEWDERDAIIEQTMKDAEDAKNDEDKVRDFLERMARSKMKNAADSPSSQ